MKLEDIKPIITESFKTAREKFYTQADKNEVDHYISQYKELKAKNAFIGKSNDISSLIPSGFDHFKKVVDVANNTFASKGDRKRSIASASSEIHTLRKSKDYHLFIPLSEEACCFYGKEPTNGNRGGWCISTRSGHNYFNHYTTTLNFIIMFLIDHNEDRIFALIIDPSKPNSFDEVHNETQDYRDERRWDMLDHITDLVGLSEKELISLGIEAYNKHDISKTYQKNTDKTMTEKLKLINKKARSSGYDNFSILFRDIWFSAPPSKTSAKQKKFIKQIIDSQFKRLKNTIFTDEVLGVARLIGGRWKEGEDVLLNSTQGSAKKDGVAYARHIIGGRWPELEEILSDFDKRVSKYTPDEWEARDET